MPSIDPEDRQGSVAEELERNTEADRLKRITTDQENAWLSSPDLASRFKVDRDKLRKRLERYRAKNHECYREVAEADRKTREPRYLYELRAVKPIIKQLMASGETSV